MQGGLRRGLHIDDDDEARKPDEYGGKYALTQDWILAEKEGTLRRTLMTCSLVEVEFQLGEGQLLRKNNKSTPASQKMP